MLTVKDLDGMAQGVRAQLFEGGKVVVREQEVDGWERRRHAALQRAEPRIALERVEQSTRCAARCALRMASPSPALAAARRPPRPTPTTRRTA